MPYELWMKYGGCLTKSYRRGVPFYTWNIYDRSLLRSLARGLIPHSKIKRRQLELVLDADKIRTLKPPGWKDEMLKIKEEIARLNKQPPQISI